MAASTLYSQARLSASQTSLVGPPPGPAPQQHQQLLYAGWRNDGSLPPHWEERIDSETSQHYFVDHKTRTTSWVDPRDVFFKPWYFEECNPGELPLGWDMAIDPAVGLYFIDHNTWTTQLEDPRLPGGGWDDLPEELPPLQPYWPAGFGGDIVDGPSRLMELQARLAEAEAYMEQLQRYGRQLPPGVENARARRQLEDAVYDAHLHVEDLKQEVALLRQQLAREGVDGYGWPAPLSRSQRLARERQIYRDETELAQLQRDIRNDYYAAAEELRKTILEEEEEELRQAREALRLRRARELQQEQQLQQQQQQASRRRAADKDGSSSRAEQAVLQLLQHQDEERRQLEQTTTKMGGLLAMQQSRDQQLTRRLEQLQQQGQLQEARLRELLAQRDRDQPLLTELLSKMDNDSTREETLASLQQLREEQKKREAEFWGELEATMDVFMPKTKLQEMFNDHAAQIDELRRLLNQQPRGPQRRFWDENLQTFIENSDGSAASSNPTSRRGSNLMAHHPPGRGAASAASAALAASAASGATNAAPRTSTPIDVPGAAAKTSTTTTAGAAQDGTLPRRSSGSRLQVGVNATDTDSIASVDAATTLSVPDHHNDGRRSSSPASAAAFTDDGLRDDRHDVPPDAPTPPPSDEAVFGVSQLLDDLGLDASHHSQDDVAELQRMHSELQEAEQTSGQRIAAVEQELEHLKRQHQQGDESSSGGGAGAGSTGAAGGKPTQRGRSSSIGLQQQQQHQLHLLRQGEFRRISLDPRPETLLADEEWMRDPHVQRLLNIKQAEQERLADMRRRIQTKVLELRRAQHERPQDMTFGEKLAYFATANRPIHGGDEAEEQQAHGSDGGGQIHNKLREDVVLSAFGEH